ncbi:uncharacterized protein MONOS_17709 [Monocercomonoides exilis]|uniref:uncharacterized protein n=1 Tax=Monocercomonoides exilis TaxID=2049356 RepID=UPI00355AB279|nr:hypothetical protein MONOS_17709 [Monocercomonoides exilis]
MSLKESTASSVDEATKTASSVVKDEGRDKTILANDKEFVVVSTFVCESPENSALNERVHLALASLEATEQSGKSNESSISALPMMDTCIVVSEVISVFCMPCQNE